MPKLPAQAGQFDDTWQPQLRRAAENEPPELKAPQLLEGAVRWYRLHTYLGSGAMGSVFIADVLDPVAQKDGSGVGWWYRDQSGVEWPETVAIKVLNSNVHDSAELLRRELAAMSAIKHPRIARLLDWRLSPAPGFIVTQYYRQGSLAGYLLEKKQLSVGEAWTLLEHLINALVAIHRACILHLDCKPGNTLLDGKGGYILADFGIAQGSRVPYKLQPSGLGTPLFQAPEQSAKAYELLDVRTDLWGVGITVWAALSGLTKEEFAKVRREAYGAAAAGKAVAFPGIETIQPDCPPALCSILNQLLQFRQQNRPGSAAEILPIIRACQRDWKDGSIQQDDLFHASSSEFRTSWRAIPGAHLIDEIEFERLNESLFDALWRSLVVEDFATIPVVRIPAGQTIMKQNEESFLTIVLLKGSVVVRRGNEFIAREEREGTFLGEITALTGTRRTAEVVAETDVLCIALNPAELELLLGKHPSLAIRLLKDLASRLQQERAARNI